MKKFLLIVVAAFAAANVSAANGVKKANFPKAQKAMVAPDAHLGLVSKSVNAAMQATVKQGAIKTIQKAPELSELIPCFAENSYLYGGEGLGFFETHMYDGASFLIEDGNVYLQPWSDLGYIKGVIEEGVTNQLSAEYGADSITFDCTVPFAELKAGGYLYLEPCVYNGETGAVSRAGRKTFGGYYIPKYNELYIPEFLSIFVEDELEKNPFSDDYVLVDLDIVPQSFYAEYTSKANITGMSLFDGTAYSNNEALVVFGSDCVYVKGVNMDFNTDAWVKFSASESDESIYYIEPYQGLGKGRLSDGSTAVLATLGAVHSDGQVTAITPDKSSTFKWIENADDTSTLVSASNTCFGSQIFTPNGGIGFNDCIAMNINITYESIVGINEVKGNKQQNDAIYNIAGQRVAKDYKGLVIKNGKKYLVK